ncbi:MAG: 3-keto-5-aminohexanoate cleavage protein, partial [Rhodovibrionaceae bacterium]|nr:3-keto-5-aminohexanoate cleavage protein [Rhodovibrionaceae bacterium]
VALNGPWSREVQPNIPISVDEIVGEGIACAKDGAAIIHVHAYDEATGRQRDDWEIYARIIEGIRASVDAIVYPTIPLAGSADAEKPMSAEERFAAVEQLARRGLIEWSIVDPGSVNFAHYDWIAEGRSGFVYLNPDDHVRYGLQLAARYGFHPSYACYEPGFVRLGAAMRREVPAAPTPVYRMLMSEGFTFSFPPRDYALDAYLRLLGEEAPGAPWMAAGLAVDIRPLIEETVARGGHVRVGLEDAPHGWDGDNISLIADALKAILNAGGEPASAADIRRELADLAGQSREPAAPSMQSP